MSKEFSIVGLKNGSGCTGRALVASPNMDDSNFEKSVIFICAHDMEGALGVIINKPLGEIDGVDAKRAFGIKSKKKIHNDLTVFYGGPVENDAFFALSLSQEQRKTFKYSAQMTLYTNADLYLKEVCKGYVSDDFLLCKGFASWDSGQLESEIESGDWMVCEIDIDEIFSTKKTKLWEKLIQKCGIKDPKLVLPYSGNA